MIYDLMLRTMPHTVWQIKCLGIPVCFQFQRPSIIRMALLLANVHNFLTCCDVTYLFVVVLGEASMLGTDHANMPDGLENLHLMTLYDQDELN